MALDTALWGFVALVVILFAASALLSATTLRREIAQAAERGDPLPRLARWWRGVASRAPWLAAAGGALLAAGIAADLAEADAGARILSLMGALVGGYALQALVVVRRIGRG